jgi:hypothetical protein
MVSTLIQPFLTASLFSAHTSSFLKLRLASIQTQSVGYRLVLVHEIVHGPHSATYGNVALTQRGLAGVD